MRSAHKLAAIVSHMYVHELSNDDFTDVQHLPGNSQPCIVLKPGDVPALLRWAVSLAADEVFVGLADDTLIVTGVVNGKLTVSVKVAVNPTAIRMVGLCGVVKVADIAALAGTRVTR